LQDPGETHNVIAEEPAISKELSAGLDRLLQTTSKGGTPASVLLRDEDSEKLGQLGYAQGGAPVTPKGGLIDPKDRVDVLFMHRNAAAVADHDPKAGIAAYQEILARYPDEPRALSQLGELLTRTGRLDEAIACYRRVTEVRPNSVVPQRSLAFLYFMKNDLPDARKAVDAALRIQPNSNQSHMLLSLILSASGQLQASLSEIDKSLAIDPHYDAALLQRAALLSALGRTGEALVALEGVDPSSPNRYAALVDALKIYEGMHRTDAIARVQTEMSALKSQGKAWPRRITLVGGGY
jgi:tetratricopeptide (TPR) repeat protein